MQSTFFMPLIIYLSMLFKFPHARDINRAAVLNFLLKMQIESLSLQI